MTVRDGKYRKMKFFILRRAENNSVQVDLTSHVQYTTYKIIACIEHATVLQANITRVTREAGEGVLSYSRLTN